MLYTRRAARSPGQNVSVLKGNIATASINVGMSTSARLTNDWSTRALTLTPVSFAMATLYLSRRDQRRAKERRQSTTGSDTSVADVITLDEEADALDTKKRKGPDAEGVEGVEVPSLTLASELRCATTLL